MNTNVTPGLARKLLLGLRWDGDCLVWKKSTVSGGYGLVQEQVNKKRVSWYAHRLTFTLTHGPIPEGALVLHSCDNRPCCNPDHLSLGTHGENMRQAVERGRMQTGSEHHRSKLTWEDVEKIRVEYAAGGVSQRHIAVTYGVTPMTVNRIIRGETWNK